LKIGNRNTTVFTGIIEELGRVRQIEKRGEDARIVIEALTVTKLKQRRLNLGQRRLPDRLDVKPNSFAADVSKETMLRSTLGSLSKGSPVNLERCCHPFTRLGGHIVQGHVGRTRTISRFRSHGESWTFRIAIRKRLRATWIFQRLVAVEASPHNLESD